MSLTTLRAKEKVLGARHAYNTKKLGYWRKRYGHTKSQLAVVRKQIATAPTGKVRRPAEVIQADVVNQSSRGGVKPALIVLHSTEGGSLESIVSWFNNPGAQASSHVVVGEDGRSARCVKDSAKAWTQANYNPQALSIEQVGFASQKSWPDPQLQKTAQYIAYWAKTFDIPIARSTTRGVCQHSELGGAGGGHHDCGPNYPFELVLGLARNYLKNGW